MAGKTTAWSTALLNLVFNNTNVTTFGDLGGLSGSATAGVFYIDLHTGDPGEAGSFSTVASYPSYAPQSLARSSAAWTISGEFAYVAADTDFPESTAGTQGSALAYWSVSRSSGSNMIYYGAISPTITMAEGVIPRLKGDRATETSVGEE